MAQFEGSGRGSGNYISITAEAAANLPFPLCEPLIPQDYVCTAPTFYIREPLSARKGREGFRTIAGYNIIGELLIAEVLTNSLKHSRGTKDISVQYAYDTEKTRLIVSIQDDDPQPPVPRAASNDAENGRGSGLIASQASAYGCYPVYSDAEEIIGKVVWFSLDLIAPSEVPTLTSTAS